MHIILPNEIASEFLVTQDSSNRPAAQWAVWIFLLLADWWWPL